MTTKTLSESQVSEFITFAEPLMKWLSENQNPHSQIVVTSTSAEILNGILCHRTED